MTKHTVDEKNILWENYKQDIRNIDTEIYQLKKAVGIDIEKLERQKQQEEEILIAKARKKEKGKTFLEKLGMLFIGLFFWDTWIN